MIRRWFSSRSWSGFVKINNLDDVIDRKRFVFRNFVQLKDVTRQARERDAELKTKEMISDLFVMIANDMIDDRAVFVFPLQRFGFMRIGDIGNDPGGERYFKRIEDDFLIPGGKIHVDQMIRKLNGNKDYRFKMVRPLHDRLRENRYKGVRYVE
jgi:hypothetical protein